MWRGGGVEGWRGREVGVEGWRVALIRKQRPTCIYHHSL